MHSNNLFFASAVENPDGTVTLPLRRGTSNGRDVYYVITDTSDAAAASSLRVNHSQKLANAAGTGAVQVITDNNGVYDFPATVDFSGTRQVAAGQQGFPPTVAQPGPMGEAGYSPLIQLPDGSVMNAPHVMNDTGQAPKVVSIDLSSMTVTYRETHGFQGGHAVHYASFDSSDMTAAALENVTYAPALGQAPSAGDDSTASSRATLVGFTNGQTGANNPQRQGFSSALLDGLDPLNVLAWNPSQGHYSPLWDVNLAQWSDAAVSGGANVLQSDTGKAQQLASQGECTGFGGGPLGASGFIVNCPIISRQ